MTDTPMYWIAPRADYDESADRETGKVPKRWCADALAMDRTRTLFQSRGQWDPCYEVKPIDLIDVDFGGMLCTLDAIVFAKTQSVLLQMRIMMLGELAERLRGKLPREDLPGVLQLRGFGYHYLFSVETRDELLPVLDRLHTACEGLIDYTIHREALFRETFEGKIMRLPSSMRPGAMEDA